jgi:hypothetical protein
VQLKLQLKRDASYTVCRVCSTSSCTISIPDSVSFSYMHFKLPGCLRPLRRSQAWALPWHSLPGPARRLAAHQEGCCWGWCLAAAQLK